MIKALSFAAFLTICLWYGPWWCLALLGLFYGLTYTGRRPFVFSLGYSFMSFVLIIALIWITDSHSGFKGGVFLAEFLSAPPFILYAFSALLFSFVLGLSCLTGSYWTRTRKGSY